MNQETAKTYVAVRNVHLGEVTLNIKAGDKFVFDGRELYHDRTGQTHLAPSFDILRRAGHVIEDDGTIDYREVAAVRPRPPSNLIIEDQENQVVGRVKLPEKVAGRERKPTEEVAKTSAATAEKRPIVTDQRVVGSAKRTPPGPALASRKEIAEAAAEQAEDVRVVNKVSRTQAMLEESLKSEGFGKQARSTVIDGDGDARVVGKLETYEERVERLNRNATELHRAADRPLSAEEEARLKADIELAKAKREGKAPQTKTASKSGDLDELGWPKDFPRNDHWQKRLQWCKDNISNLKALRVVYKHPQTSDGFRAQLKKAFPDVSFEE